MAPRQPKIHSLCDVRSAESEARPSIGIDGVSNEAMSVRVMFIVLPPPRILSVSEKDAEGGDEADVNRLGEVALASEHGAQCLWAL